MWTQYRLLYFWNASIELSSNPGGGYYYLIFREKWPTQDIAYMENRKYLNSGSSTSSLVFFFSHHSADLCLSHWSQRRTSKNKTQNTPFPNQDITHPWVIWWVTVPFPNDRKRNSRDVPSGPELLQPLEKILCTCLIKGHLGSECPFKADSRLSLCGFMCRACGKESRSVHGQSSRLPSDSIKAALPDWFFLS